MEMTALLIVCTFCILQARSSMAYICMKRGPMGCRCIGDANSGVTANCAVNHLNDINNYIIKPSVVKELYVEHINV